MTETSIDSLPIEMRINLLSYLPKRTLRDLRLISRWVDQDIRCSRLFKVPSVALNDTSAKNVLKSKALIYKLTVCDFLKPTLISSWLGEAVFQNAFEIVFGKQINTKNMTKILKNLDRVRKISFEATDHTGLVDFGIYNRTYEHLETLNLFLGNRSFESDFLNLLVRQDGKKFPNLQKLTFRWNHENINMIDTENCSTLWIHNHVYKLVWIHRNSLKSIVLDFRFKAWSVIPTVGMPGNLVLSGFAYIELINLRVQLLDVSELQDVEIWSLYESLSTPLTSVQKKLVRLSFHPPMFEQPAILVMQKIGEQNSKTIEILEISPWAPRAASFSLIQFSVYSVLKELRMPGIPYRPEDIIHLPLSLTSLSISFGNPDLQQILNNLLHPVDGTFQSHRQALAWISGHLKLLISFEAFLEGAFSMTVLEMKTLINDLPDLIKLKVILPIYPVIVQNPIKLCKAALVGKKGISMKLTTELFPQPHLFDAFFALHCKINRTTFKPFYLI